MRPKSISRCWPVLFLAICPFPNDVLAQQSSVTTSASSALVDALVIDRVISDIEKLVIACESDLMELSYMYRVGSLKHNASNSSANTDEWARQIMYSQINAAADASTLWYGMVFKGGYNQWLYTNFVEASTGTAVGWARPESYKGLATSQIHYEEGDKSWRCPDFNGLCSLEYSAQTTP
mmetsp:Transcript_7232/g.17451  ORF Transcript_7232/g.17451 Transcript_7232/m.17451 type:complete len:179 (+) Transcript_7232:52-588(+)